MFDLIYYFYLDNIFDTTIGLFSDTTFNLGSDVITIQENLSLIATLVTIGLIISSLIGLVIWCIKFFGGLIRN